MKKLIIIINLFFCLTAFAQKDSVIYSTEVMPQKNDSLIKAQHKKDGLFFWTKSQIEATKMLKIAGSVNGAFGNGLMISEQGIHLGYEQKIRPSFSLVTELRGDLAGYFFSQKLSVGGHYYYDLAKKIKKGTSVNNFNASYLYLKSNVYHSNAFGNFQPSISLGWGSQAQTFFKFAFIDFGLGANYNFATKSITAETKFIIGLDKTWYKTKKK